MMNTTAAMTASFDPASDRRRLYHGTDTTGLGSMQRAGVRSACWTTDYDLALYYAEQAAEATETDPVVIQATLPLTALQHDHSALHEPVWIGEPAEALAAQHRTEPDSPLTRDEYLWARLDVEAGERGIDDWDNLPVSVTLDLMGCAIHPGVITDFTVA